MKIVPQSPLVVLVLGAVLGGGIVHTAWSLRSGETSKETAEAAVSGLRRPSTRSQSTREIRSKERLGPKSLELAVKDPRKAWAQSLKMTHFAERAAFVGELMREWGMQDPVAALEMAATLPAGQLRQEAYDAACAGWASQHPEAASKWAAEHLTGPLAGEVFTSIASEWAGNDPAAAAAWVAGLPNSTVAEGAATAVICAWVEKDPRAAISWIDTFRDDEERSAALATLTSEWSLQSPTDAARWVDSRLGGPEASELAEALVGSWGAQDPEAAAQWVMNLKDTIQTNSVSTLLSLWSDSDPQAAAEWAEKFPEGETRSEAIGEVASTWAASEPEKAVAWTLGLPDSPGQREALDDAVRTWTSLAPDGLGKWVEMQPVNEATDHLRSTAAAILVQDHPLDALAMAGKISNPEQRDASLTRLLNRWGREDQAAARAWIGQAGLPPGVTDRLTFPDE